MVLEQSHFALTRQADPNGLSYTQSQLYSLIADIPRYSSFIPFCTCSNVLDPGSKTIIEKAWRPDDQPFDVEAEMCVGFGGLDERFISRVTGRPFESVTVSACFPA